MLDAWHSEDLDAEAPPSHSQRGLGNRGIAATQHEPRSILLTNPRQYRADLRLLLHALANGWEAPERDVQAHVHDRLLAVIRDKSGSLRAHQRAVLRACHCAVKMQHGALNLCAIIRGERIPEPRMLTASQRELRALLKRNPALRAQLLEAGADLAALTATFRPATNP